MQAYHYNDLRFFDGEVTCQIDPVESGNAHKNIYLTPANSTFEKPDQQEGYTPRWNGESWEQYADDAVVYGYTENDDGTINYYGSAHITEDLQRLNPDVELLFADNEPVSVNGVYWLSADNPDYQKAKKEADKQVTLDALNAQYDSDKAVLVAEYTDALMHDDTETAEAIKGEMLALDEQYDIDYEEIMSEEDE